MKLCIATNTIKAEDKKSYQQLPDKSTTNFDVFNRYIDSFYFLSFT